MLHVAFVIAPELLYEVTSAMVEPDPSFISQYAFKSLEEV